MKINATYFFSAMVALLVAASCSSRQQSGQEAPDSIDTIAYMKSGDSITRIMQEVLLKNVMQATKAGGAVYAVEFCNERAIPLTDSLSAIYNCRIQRISDRFRNPANKPTESDLPVLEGMMSSGQAKPVVTSDAGSIVYYKPIKIGMASCLNCHGSENGQIDRNILDVIKQKYPADNATGYKEGDLRGAWKITFQKPEQH